MGIVNVFKGLNSQREIFNFNGSIRDNLTLNWDYVKIYKDSENPSPEYEVQENDVLVVQEFPAGTGTGSQGWDIFLGVITGGIYTAVISYNMAKEAEKEMQKTLDRLNKSNKNEVASIPNLSGGRNELASGKTAPIILGRHLFTPYFLSEPYMRPQGTDGEDLYFYATLLAGQNGLHIEKLRNGMTDLITYPEIPILQTGKKEFDTPAVYDPDNPPPFHEPGNFAIIMQDNYVLPPEYSIFEEKWVDSLDSTVEIGRKKKDDAEVIDEKFIADNGPEEIERKSARFPMRLEIEVMIDGLFGWDSENSKSTDAGITIKLHWSKDRITWHPIQIEDENWYYLFEVNVINKNTMRQLRYLAKVNLPSDVFSKTGEPVYVRAIRLSHMHTGGYKDKIYLTAIRTKQYNVEKSSPSKLVAAKNINERFLYDPATNMENKFCRIGIKIKVNENTQEEMDKFNIIASMTGRIWNGTKWSTEKAPTSNPAAVALEVLTGLIHTPSKYEDWEIDLYSFRKLYEFCQDRKVTIDNFTRTINNGRGLECNGVLTSPVKKIELIKSILGTCEAGLYIDEFGKLFAYYDRAQEAPIALLNPQRLVKLTEQRNLGLLPDYYNVEFIDEEVDWSNATHEIIRPRIPKKEAGTHTHSPLKLTYVTSYEHAMWLTRRYMAKEILRPGETKAVVGKEGRFYKPGSLIKVQHERFKLGIGSGEVINPVIEDNKIIGLRLMEKFFLSKDRDYFVDYYVVNEKGNHVVNSKQIQSTGDYTDTLFFTVPVDGTSIPDERIPINSEDAPEMGNILSVIDHEKHGTGVIVRESKRYLVSDLSENADGYDLSLVQYHDDIYNEEGDIYSIPEYQSSIIQALPREYNSLGDRQTVQEGRIPDPQQISQQTGTQIAATSPRYRGLVIARPENDNTPTIGNIVANRGDYVMFNGEKEGIWDPARMYQWDGTKWEQLIAPTATNRTNADKYLEGTSSLTEGAPDAVFSLAQVRSLVAEAVFTTLLYGKEMVLHSNGVFYTDGFMGVNGNVPGAKITAATGLLEAIGARFKNLTVNNGTFENVTVSGMSKFNGIVKPTTGIQVSHYWGAFSDRTQDDWYEVFSKIIPNYGDRVSVFGGGYIFANVNDNDFRNGIMVFVERLNSSTIELNLYPLSNSADRFVLCRCTSGNKDIASKRHYIAW
jgi:hypothetical protein